MVDTYAVILNGFIVNTVLASPGDYFDPQYTWVIISTLNPQPQIGYAYDGTNFSNPNNV